MHSFEAQNEHFFTYLLLLIDNTLKGASVIATHCLERVTKLPNNSAPQLLMCGRSLIPEYHALAPVLCMDDTCVHILSCFTIGRNP
jgi:hypothetical protein